MIDLVPRLSRTPGFPVFPFPFSGEILGLKIAQAPIARGAEDFAARGIGRMSDLVRLHKLHRPQGQCAGHRLRFATGDLALAARRHAAHAAAAHAAAHAAHAGGQTFAVALAGGCPVEVPHHAQRLVARADRVGGRGARSARRLRSEDEAGASRAAAEKAPAKPKAKHGEAGRRDSFCCCFLFLVGCLLLVAMPFAPSSVLAPSSKARSP